MTDGSLDIVCFDLLLYLTPSPHLPSLISFALSLASKQGDLSPACGGGKRIAQRRRQDQEGVQATDESQIRHRLERSPC